MNWLSSGLKKVNKTLKPLRGVGKVLGGGLDVVSDFLPPGFRDVGNVAAKLMQNKNLKSSLIGAGTDYLGGKLGGAIAGKLGGMKKLPTGIQGTVPDKVGAFDLQSVIGNATGGMPSASAAAAQQAARSGGGGLGSQILGGLKKVGGDFVQQQMGGGGGSILDRIGGIGGLADAGLGAASLAAGISAGNKAQGYRDKALALSEGSWNDRAGLRKLGLEGLQNNTPQDLSSVFANPSNPFMRRVS